MNSVIDRDTANQFCYRFETLRNQTQVGIARLIQSLQIRGFGHKLLLDAMIEAEVENDCFYHEGAGDDRIGRLYWIANDNGRIVGDGLTVDQIHTEIARSGITV